MEKENASQTFGPTEIYHPIYFYDVDKDLLREWYTVNGVIVER